MKFLGREETLTARDRVLVLSAEVANSHDNFQVYMEQIDWCNIFADREFVLILKGNIKREWLQAIKRNDSMSVGLDISELENPDVLIDGLSDTRKNYIIFLRTFLIVDAEKIRSSQSSTLQQFFRDLSALIQHKTKGLEDPLFHRLELRHFSSPDNECLSHLSSELVRWCDIYQNEAPQQAIDTLAAAGIRHLQLAYETSKDPDFDITSLKFHADVEEIFSWNLTASDLLNLLDNNPHVKRVSVRFDLEESNSVFMPPSIRSQFFKKMHKGLKLYMDPFGANYNITGWHFYRKILNANNTDLFAYRGVDYNNELRKLVKDFRDYPALFDATHDTVSVFDFLTFSRMYELILHDQSALESCSDDLKAVFSTKDNDGQSLAGKMMLERDRESGQSLLYDIYSEQYILSIQVLEFMRLCDRDSFTELMCADFNNEHRACRDAENLLFVICFYRTQDSPSQKEGFIEALSILSGHGKLFQDGTQATHFNAALGRVSDLRDLYVSDQKGITGWHYAAAMGRIELFQQLSPKGLGQVAAFIGKSEVNDCTLYAGCTVLFVAVSCGQDQIVSYIFKQAERIQNINVVHQTNSKCEEETCLTLFLKFEDYALAQLCWDKMTCSEQRDAYTLIAKQVDGKAKYPNLMSAFGTYLQHKKGNLEEMDLQETVLGKRKAPEVSQKSEEGSMPEQQASVSSSSPSSDFFDRPSKKQKIDTTSGSNEDNDGDVEMEDGHSRFFDCCIS